MYQFSPKRQPTHQLQLKIFGETGLRHVNAQELQQLFSYAIQVDSLLWEQEIGVSLPRL
jgi:hypothetical protein